MAAVFIGNHADQVVIVGEASRLREKARDAAIIGPRH